jgi:hypothetical protein
LPLTGTSPQYQHISCCGAGTCGCVNGVVCEFVWFSSPDVAVTLCPCGAVVSGLAGACVQAAKDRQHASAKMIANCFFIELPPKVLWQFNNITGNVEKTPHRGWFHFTIPDGGKNRSSILSYYSIKETDLMLRVLA